MWHKPNHIDTEGHRSLLSGENGLIGLLHLDELGHGAVDEVLEGPGVRDEQGAELPLTTIVSTSNADVNLSTQ